MTWTDWKRCLLVVPQAKWTGSASESRQIILLSLVLFGPTVVVGKSLYWHLRAALVLVTLVDTVWRRWCEMLGGPPGIWPRLSCRAKTFVRGALIVAAGGM